MTALIDTLFQLEKQLGIELDSLMPYAEADNIGGYHPDPAQRKWGAGAIWDVEGRTLYALIRALKPENIVEIGSGTGCSTTHMASALDANDEFGHITTIDRGNTPQIPGNLKTYVTISNGDAINYLALQPDNSIDFILEDADHSTELCAAIGELAKTKLKPGGVLMAHDAAHFGVGADVKRGYDLAGLDFRVYLTDPSDCGWAVWKRPSLPEGARVQSDGSVVREYTQTEQDIMRLKHQHGGWVDYTVLQGQEEPNATPEKPKRTRKKAAK